MTITFRTVVLELASTPLGLLPERWGIEHWCVACGQRVASEKLVPPARAHEPTIHEGGLTID
jgi:hypothetical protein